MPSFCIMINMYVYFHRQNITWKVLYIKIKIKIMCFNFERLCCCFRCCRHKLQSCELHSNKNRTLSHITCSYFLSVHKFDKTEIRHIDSPSHSSIITITSHTKGNHSLYSKISFIRWELSFMMNSILNGISILYKGHTSYQSHLYICY